MRERRNVVLSLMRQNGYIGDRDYAKAAEAPINVPKAAAQSIEAPYFVDMVSDTLQSKFQDTDLQANAYPHLYHPRYAAAAGGRRSHPHGHAERG